MADNTPLSVSQSKPRRHYSFFVKFVAVVTSVVLTLLVLEVGTRVVFAMRGLDIRSYQPSFTYAPGASTRFDRSRFTSHPFLPFAPRPYDNRKLYVYREGLQGLLEFDVKNDSHGFRTPERPFEKAPNVKRIIIFGGSTTWEGLTNDVTWPALLEKKLNAEYEKTGARVEVINLSVDMASSPMSLVNLAFTGIEYHPDLVVSYDGVNDSFLIGFEGETPDYRSTMGRYDDRIRPLQSRLPSWAFKSYLISVASKKYDSQSQAGSDLYSFVIANKTNQLKLAANPLAGIQYFERNLKSMRAIAGENNARFVASTAHWSDPSPKISAMNADLREFFQRNRIDYLDLDEALPHHDSSIHTDAVHWTEKGLDEVAEQWKTKIVAADLLGLK